LKDKLSKLTERLTRFKQQCDVHETAVQGEWLSVNDQAAASFCTEFQKFMLEENLNLEHIYNADETILYWKGLPIRILTFKREKFAPGQKPSKEHLTVMHCGNASGNQKIKLEVILFSFFPWLHSPA
jgi:hypothetical protein